MPRDEVEDMSHQLVWQLIHLQSERRKSFLLLGNKKKIIFCRHFRGVCSDLLFHSFPM
jgi:hypothetical protein